MRRGRWRAGLEERAGCKIFRMWRSAGLAGEWLRQRHRRSAARSRRFGIARSVYVRGLGAVYFVAIVSWWVQLDGLVGNRGIVPAVEFLERAEEHYGGRWAAFPHVPTLCWLYLDEGGLHALCAGGTVLAAAVMAGIWTGPFLLFLWIIYLSLAVTGGVFMNFQWDALLLEAGLLGPLLAPWRCFLRRGGAAVSRWALFLHWWLLFRLMFFSGYVKIASGDQTWRSCRALDFHYETQPIPSWISWYAHQLPGWFQWSSCVVMFGIELALPFFIFLGRLPRLAACFGFIILNSLIVLTGNYTYFNYLTILLCVPLLDDSLWPRLLRRDRSGGAEGRHESPSLAPDSGAAYRWIGSGARLLAGGFVLLLSGVVVFQQLGADLGKAPDWMKRARLVASPFRSVNGYGLFAVMTTQRPELEVEGSMDGEEWRTYRFRWKAGNLERWPRFVAPHQPRLDWQMWFEALAATRGIYDFQRGGWFGSFLFRLLEGSNPVLELLEEDPFPGRRPVYLRVRAFDYRFTDFEERAATGHWWKREFNHEYCPAIRLGPK